MDASVTLREERFAGGSRHLRATYSLLEGLRVEGQDLGGGTESMSDDGEYEWSYVIRPWNIPALRLRLGVPSGADLIHHLRAHCTGDASYEFERLTHDLRSDFSSWR